ncbi:hypothetical protein EAL2_c09060 [Peptoclostridium acidaminophilum DSM 3953]|uniref:Uncharacterized protein n=1 Tax=Peptoclostridium acidaminophilum DSM 3953 TaxID=1286171 RepID=W8U5K3_PEPAC|nr:hypothetical protein [Peptoclostridium acidaminophilum]AHM56206.1 hypothetical protein EAL2_c09060 [Peptoclostridium acidaminophilum DSM 3953]
MEPFDELSIENISKRDLLLILKSLEFTYENTKLDEFSNLRKNIIEELCFLTNSSQDEFLRFLEK